MANTGNKKTLHVLNDLIRINIDRISGYEKAAHEELTPEPEFRDLFYRFALESRANVNNLHAEVIRLGGHPVNQSTITGKIYLYWLEGKNNFDGTDTVVCSAAELAVQKAYQQALDDEDRLPNEIYDLVETQLWGLERAHRTLLDLKARFNQLS